MKGHMVALIIFTALNYTEGLHVKPMLEHSDCSPTSLIGTHFVKLQTDGSAEFAYGATKYNTIISIQNAVYDLS